ncbi:MAG: wax ester/triacylglycerol synthase family O-acyltransferase [Acidobacteriota bacterium]
MDAPKPELVSGIDSAWLHMDEPANRMVVTLVLIFEHRLPRHALDEVLQHRLVHLPRFRQRIVDGPEGPQWEEDPNFHIYRHVNEVALEDPFDESELQRLVSRLMSRSFNRSRPLWHLYLVPHYRRGSALIARIHHCIGDGLGLIYVFLSLADKPDGKDDSRFLACVSAASPAPVTSGLLDAATATVSGLGRAALGGTFSFARLLTIGADEQTPLKGTLGIEKRATWSTPVPLEDVKAASRALGVTVNDVLVTAATGALRNYLLSRGADVDGIEVRGVVPVNLRRAEDSHELGNRFGLVFLSLPVGLTKPQDRLQSICRRMRALKDSYEPVMTFQILQVLGLAPRGILERAIDFFGEKATAVITNVVGPREPVTFAGVRLSRVMFWVPCAGRLGVGISILSYAGFVSIGFATDAGLVPDPECIVQGFDGELARLIKRASQAQIGVPV